MDDLSEEVVKSRDKQLTCEQRAYTLVKQRMRKKMIENLRKGDSLYEWEKMGSATKD